MLSKLQNLILINYLELIVSHWVSRARAAVSSVAILYSICKKQVLSITDFIIKYTLYFQKMCTNYYKAWLNFLDKNKHATNTFDLTNLLGKHFYLSLIRLRREV